MGAAIEQRFRRLREWHIPFASADNGTMAVEFGFIAPFVIALLLGAIEVSQAISDQLQVQAAARVGSNFGLAKPPVQGNVQPVIESVRAALPPEWIASANADKAVIAASILCECEVSGPAQCGAPCGAGERIQTYLRVDVTKPYKPMLQIRYLPLSFTLRDTSLVRLQ
jgi:TadE-like protein